MEKLVKNTRQMETLPLVPHDGKDEPYDEKYCVA